MANMTGDELLKLFTQYAIKEGGNQLLSMTGLNNLMKDHFSNFMGSLTVNDITKFTRIDEQGRISFDVFKALIDKMSGLSMMSGLANLVS